MTPKSIRRVRVTGGPSPVDITVMIDGVKQESVNRVELILDVNDAVRARVTYISQVVFDGEATVTKGHQVKLNHRVAAPGGEIGDVMWATTHTAVGATLSSALRDLAHQIEEEERKASG